MPASQERYTRAKELFLQTCALAPERREAFLRNVCPGDEELRREVGELLALLPPTEAGVAAASPGAASWTDTLPSFPEMLGEYLVLRPLGQGSMGSVYLAEHTGTRERVALKLLRGGLFSPQLRERFHLEAEALRRLDHPGIAALSAAGLLNTPSGPWPYLAMEFVDGRPLHDFEPREDREPDQGPDGARERTPGRATDRGRIEILARIFEAVDHAHQRGIIHRDLKPANILVTSSGQPKILDFGVARLFDIDARATAAMTQAGQIIGTLQYMSPEQAGAIAAALSPASDVYSLGVIAFELISGRLPYVVPAGSFEQAITAILRAEPPPVTCTTRGFRDPLGRVVARALARNPLDRYPTAGAMASDLRRVLDGRPISVPADSLRARLARAAHRLRRNRRGRLLAATALGLALLVASVLTLAPAFRPSLGERGTDPGNGGSRWPWRSSSNRAPALPSAPLSSAEIRMVYGGLFDRILEASRAIHIPSADSASLRVAIGSLRQCRREIAALAPQPFTAALLLFIPWRMGEASFFLGGETRDPRFFEEALDFWQQAGNFAEDPRNLEGLEVNAMLCGEVGRLGAHHPYSGVAGAFGSLAFSRDPAGNLGRQLEHLAAVEESQRKAGIRGYPPSGAAARNYREDRGMLLHDLAGANLAYGAAKDSLSLLDAALSLLAQADTSRALAELEGAHASFVRTYGKAWMEHALRTGSPAEADSAIARLEDAAARAGRGGSNLGYAGTRRLLARAYRVAASLASDPGQRQAHLARGGAAIQRALAALDPREAPIDHALVAQEAALILGDRAAAAVGISGLAASGGGASRPSGATAEGTVSALTQLASADSLLDLAANELPKDRFPAQFAEICYGRGRTSRIRWQVMGAEADRTRALDQFRLAGEYLSRQQHPNLHRRMREEGELLGTNEPL